MTDSDNDSDDRRIKLKEDISTYAEASAAAETARHAALHASINRLGHTDPEVRYMAASIAAVRLSHNGPVDADAIDRATSELVDLARGVEDYLRHG